MATQAIWSEVPGAYLVFLRVRTGTHVGDTPVPLSVSLNGQQFVDVLESLTYVFEGP